MAVSWTSWWRTWAGSTTEDTSMTSRSWLVDFTSSVLKWPFSLKIVALHALLRDLFFYFALLVYCAGSCVQPDSGEEHPSRLDHVQSQYRSDAQSRPFAFNTDKRSASATCSFAPNLLRGKLHHSWRHPRSASGHVHQTAQLDEGMSYTHI